MTQDNTIKHDEKLKKNTFSSALIDRLLSQWSPSTFAANISETVQPYKRTCRWRYLTRYKSITDRESHRQAHDDWMDRDHHHLIVVLPPLFSQHVGWTGDGPPTCCFYRRPTVDLCVCGTRCGRELYAAYVYTSTSIHGATRAYNYGSPRSI